MLLLKKPLGRYKSRLEDNIKSGLYNDVVDILLSESTDQYWALEESVMKLRSP